MPLRARHEHAQPYIMTRDESRAVVVGFDGSSSAASAVEAAASEALALGMPLRIVHAYAWPILYASLANVPFQASDWEPAPAVVATVTAEADRVAKRHPELAVQTAVQTGGGGEVLVGASAGAALVVVGDRGLGGFTGRVAGPVAKHVMSHAQCPVLVVRAGQALATAGGHVVVGVDSTGNSRHTLRFACEWAQRRVARIVAIHAIEPGSPGPEAGSTQARLILDGWIEPFRTEFPMLSIGAEVVRATPSAALLAASRSARLVVVGSASPGEATTSTIGPVRRTLIQRSACPVVVVPAPESAADDLHGLVSGQSGRVRGTGMIGVGKA